MRTHRLGAKCLFIELGEILGGSHPGGQPKARLRLAQCKMPSGHPSEAAEQLVGQSSLGSEDRFLPQVRPR